MKATLRPTIIIFCLLSIICAFIYPITLTVLGNFVFPKQVAGSLLMHKNIVIGSRLIGQYFNNDQYFWSRPSATIPFAYNTNASQGSNFSTTNPKLLALINARSTILKSKDPNNNLPIPIDLITASASGLDPEISLAAAYYQAGRIANLRKVPQITIENLINQHKQTTAFGLLSNPRVNVLQLNIALDNLTHATS